MSNFKDALLKGLEAQKKLEQTKRDLAKVLEEATEAVTDVLGTDTVFKLNVSSKTIEGVQTRIAEAMGFVPSKTRQEYWVIQASKPKALVNLAEVEFSETGYPVTFTWPDRSATAFKPEDLAQAVEEVLSSRYVGEKLSSWVQSGG